MSDQNQTAEQAETKAETEQTQSAKGEQAQETKAEKTYTQAELDAKVEERLMRERKQASDREAKARAEAEAKALAEQGEFKKLSETQAKQLLDLTTERDTLATQLEEQTANAKKYEKALMSILDAQKAGVPEHVKPLLDKLPIDEQMAWIAANQDKVKPNGVPFTPKADATGLTAAQKEAVQKQTDRYYRRNF